MGSVFYSPTLGRKQAYRGISVLRIPTINYDVSSLQQWHLPKINQRYFFWSKLKNLLLTTN